MKNALTFDVEEYFHAEAFAATVPPRDWPALASRVGEPTKRLLDMLDARGVRATFFVLGWVAERHPALVHEIAGRGHEVGCHGYAHRMIHRMTRQELTADVRRGKALVEDAAGVEVIGYRAPTFSVVRETLWGLEVLAELGFRYDSSIFPVRHDRYGIPDAARFPALIHTPSGGIAEFPPSTVVLLGRRLPVAGGGYLRLVPYAVTSWAIRRINGVERQPAMVYLHPWEIDPGQPRLPSSWLARQRHTVNLGRTERKIERLLGDFAFAPARAVLEGSGLLGEGRP